MENNPRSMREEEVGFDWPMFMSQNPSTDYFAPSSSTTNGGSTFQPPMNPFVSSSSSMRSVNGNGVFLVDNGVLPFQINKQQQLPATGNLLGVNPVRSILDYSDRFPAEFDPYGYCCNTCHPDQLYRFNDFQPRLASFAHRSLQNGFQETLIDRNLELDFSRLNLGNSYSQVRVPRNNYCRDMCCNPHSSRRINSFDQLNSRGCNYNVFDQNPRNYPNPNIISSPLSQNRVLPKRTKFPASLKDIRGKIYSVAMTQEGCQFLQTKCEEGAPEEIEMIFNEIKDYICELMTDTSMNYLAQKLFKVCNERQMTQIVVSVIADDGNLTNICLNSHGTRAMQKLIELVTTTEQRCLIVSALRRITLTLTKNTNGHHVIQHCLKSFHVDEVQAILNVVAENCLDIAIDKSGCCVLQQCVVYANGASKERLMSGITENALRLAEHPYGNYVVQHLLGMQLRDVSAKVLQKLGGNCVSLAMNKYASHVIERCLRDAPDDQTVPIIREMLSSPNFLSVIQNPFGNFVIQTALETTKGSLKETLIKRIQKEYAFIQSHPHGKSVLAMLKTATRGTNHA